MALRHTFREVLATGGANTLPPDLLAQLRKIFPDIEHSAASGTSRMKTVALDSSSNCLIDYANGKKIDLAEAKRRLIAGLMSNNPLDEVNYRWGEHVPAGIFGHRT